MTETKSRAKRNSSDLTNYSKEKYTTSFSSNIFNTDINAVGSCPTTSNGNIKVNRKVNAPQFVPKFKELNSFERKIQQLKGSQTSLKSASLSEIPESSKSSQQRACSIGLYNHELVNSERRLKNLLTAKERYYASLVSANPITASSNQGQALFTNNTVTKMDNSRIVFDNKTSSDILKESLFTSKVFSIRVSKLNNNDIV